MKRKILKHKRIFVITGAAGGLGRALSRKLAMRDSFLFLIDKRDPKNLVKEIADMGFDAKGITFDLTKISHLDSLIEKIFRKLESKGVKSIVLINNAGLVSPIAFAGNFAFQEAIMNLSVNCVAPIILSSLLISKIKHFKGQKLIINISSGAARRPISGWSLYCSGKSAVEMFTACVFNEQKMHKGGISIYTFDPGALDTDMQTVIRQANKGDFPEVERFIKWHKVGSLKKAESAAQEIADFIMKKFGNYK